MDIVEERTGFTPITHPLFELLVLTKLTKRELKICLLICRLTFGCNNRRWARLTQANLAAINIGSSHAGEVMKQVLVKGVVLQNDKTKEYKINEDYFTRKTTKKVNFQLGKLRKLIGKQLGKSDYQSGNQKTTKAVTENILKREIFGYQNSNPYELPEREVPNSKRTGFQSPKDILNKVKHNDIDSFANKSFGKLQRIDPYKFRPSNNSQACALKAWKQIEPNNPESFGFYLSVARHGLPDVIFGQFASEIKSDPNISNPGAVFNVKVRNYLKTHDLI